ncbi:MAG: Gfo/Idh/MocA family oxidoreductase [Spirochaetaceae bacterium]
MKNTKIKAVIIGAGSRGVDAYSTYAERYPNELDIIAVAEPREDRRSEFCKRFNIEESNSYPGWIELLSKDRMADVAFICTPDRLHVEPAIEAMKKGYHLLLEKPVAIDVKGCMDLLSNAKKYNVSVIVAHVLRYTPFFSTIKKILDNGTIGNLKGIQHNENIGYIHYSHSYVRGNWSKENESSPVILSKSSHDMDILLYLAGDDCSRLSSFGSRGVFQSKNRPEGAPSRCLSGCKHRTTCSYYAPKIYLEELNTWPANILTVDQTFNGIITALKEGPYGRCVYDCDNDVMEHQTMNIEFKNGVQAVFTLSAFTNETSRTIKLVGEKGEIRGAMEKNTIEIHNFETKQVTTIKTENPTTGHSGGDEGIVKDLIMHLENKEHKLPSPLELSIQSHLMALAAEESRLNGVLINMDDFTSLNK